LPLWWTPGLGIPGGRGPYFGDPCRPSRWRPSSSWWTPPPRPSGTRWPLGWRDTVRGVAPGFAVTAAGGSSTRAQYAGEPAAAAAPYYGGGYSYSAGGASAAGHTAYAGGYTAAATALSPAPRLTWGPVPTGRGPAHEYPFDPPVRDHYGWYAREDLPRSPDLCKRPAPWRAGAGERRVRLVLPPFLSVPSWVGRSPRVARGRPVVCSCLEGPVVGGGGFFPLSGVCEEYPALGVGFLIPFFAP